MSDDKIMLAVPVSGSYDDNMDLNLYCDPKKGNYGYLGLYTYKKISAVGKVTKIVTFKNVDGDYDTDVAVTDDEKARFLELKRRVLQDEPESSFGESEEKIYFVDKFYSTNYENVGSTGIIGSKKFLLDKLLPASTKEIAEQLNGQTWQLVKGQDIMPVRKNIPLVADRIMLAVPVSETYEINTELNIYFSSSKDIHEYIGLYEKKSIRAVGKIVKVIEFENVNGKISIKNEVTSDEEREVLKYKKLCEEKNPNYVFNSGKIYFVDKFYPTNYKNIGSDGIRNGKKILLKKLLPASTAKIAYQLNGQTWQLVKGQDIMPVGKDIPQNIPLVADKIMLAVPVSETYEINIKLNIYFSASRKNIHEYIGLYKDKSIKAVGKIEKVIEFENVNGEILIKNAVTSEEEHKVLDYKKLCEEKNPNYVFNSGKIYFVDKFYPTDYKNIGSTEIIEGENFLLEKLLPASMAEIAYQLSGQTWQLIKGKDVVPEKKPPRPIGF